MSMDDLPPPKAGETAEITIEVEGAIDDQAFRQFKQKLKACIRDLADATPSKRVRWNLAAIKRK